MYRSLRAGNGDRCLQARRHCLALFAESAIRLAERAPDATRQYHRLPSGQVVSKCALRGKKERSAPVSRNAPALVMKNARVKRPPVRLAPFLRLKDRSFPRLRLPESASVSGLFALSRGLWPALPPVGAWPEPVSFRLLSKTSPLSVNISMISSEIHKKCSYNHNPAEIATGKVTVAAHVFTVSFSKTDSKSRSKWQNHRLLMKSIAMSRSSSTIVFSADGEADWIACRSAVNPASPVSEDCKPSRIVSSTF